MDTTGHLRRRRPKKIPRSVEQLHEKEFKIHRSILLLREYTQCSTIHGIQHIFRGGESWLHCMIWVVLWTLSTCGAAYMVHNCWKNYSTHPIAISIVDTQHPLKEVWFPAVAFCPSNKIMLQPANEYLSRYIRDQKILNSTALLDFYKSLSMLQYPLYVQMQHFLQNCDHLLPQLAHINITDLMYHALPKCEQLFTRCYWKGIRANCCSEIFTLQRSEEGFCYSFNSVTSEPANTSCKYFDAHNKVYKGCKLERLTSQGPSTGLEVYFKMANWQENPSLDFTEGPKLKVQVFHPNEFPEPGMFNLIPINGHNKLNVEVKPTVTESTEGIKSLDVKARGCVFKEEVKTTKMTGSYSQRSCQMECRMAYMLRKCYCLPYYFNRLGSESAPTCSSVQLPCILNASSDLRAFSPPEGFKSFLPTESNQPLRCSHCNPTCNEVTYDVQLDATKDLHHSNGRHRNFDGYIDVYYGAPGAVMYSRDLTYNFTQLLVDFGGIGSLFLGGSFLSIMEVLYWVSKAAISFLWPTDPIMQKKLNSKQPFLKK